MTTSSRPAAILAALLALSGAGRAVASEPAVPPLYTYALPTGATAAAYDEALAVATVQGVINRTGPTLYVLPDEPAAAGPVSIKRRPHYWLEILSRPGDWLAGRQQVPVTGLEGLVKLAGPRLKGAVIWDPAVPATANVATTIAGVRDAVVLSPQQADQFLASWRLPVIEDLRDRFTGAETGSAKNDAYRWALREYLAKGLCSSRFLCLYHDPHGLRQKGEVGYIVTRDWAVKNRSFVFDLSPWGDEVPADDPGQKLGTDLETYRMILAETLRQTGGRHMTEITGFFSFEKYSHFGGHESRHEPVPTEWETVHLISPYNVYQNTVSDNCFNQSLHSQAPRAPLRQHRVAQQRKIEAKTYLCILMADYDSATPTYDTLPRVWDDPNRGKVPLAWGINPNLLDTYPDVIAHFYRTLTPADTITADAGAAGYINPSRILPEHLPLFVRHNQRYFREADLTLAPMVLDWKAPGAAVKDAFRQFAPDGMGSMVWDMHTNTGEPVRPHVWHGMPVLQLRNEANEFPGPEKTADILAASIMELGNPQPGFLFFRIVWTNPTSILRTLEVLRSKYPAINFEVVDPLSYFGMAREFYSTAPGSTPPATRP